MIPSIPISPALAFLLAATMTPPASTSSDLRSRIKEKDLAVYTEKLTDAGREVLSGLCDLSARRGAMPSLSDFRRAVATPGHKLSQVDYDHLLVLFSQAQSPPIENSALVDLFRAYRRSIVTARLSYTLDRRDGDLQEAVADHRELVLDGPKVLLTARRLSPAGREATARTISYDGSILRTYDQYADSPGSAGLRPLDSRGRFYREENPLGMSMLLDSASDMGEEDSLWDFALVAAITGVNETPEEFSGVRCVVVGTPDRAYYLDPNKGYAVRGTEEQRYYFDGEAGRLVERSRFAERRNDDFIPLANGIWLPKRMERTIRVDGKAHSIATINVEMAEINGAVDAKVFEDLKIPDGTTVGDRLRNAVYEKGADESVEHTVQSALDRWKGRRGGHLGWIVALNAAAFVAIVYFAVRAHRRNRVS